MNRAICLNADLGELPGARGRALDAEMLAVVTRCNIACGGHAGDEESMRETLRCAAVNGVRSGAHPSYPDIEHFGRRSLTMPREALAAALSQQVAALVAIAAEEGVRLAHLKAHGALYNDAALDGDLAVLIANLARSSGIGEVIGPPKGVMRQAVEAAGLRFVAEGFADRSYETDGTLTPRALPGAVLENSEGMLEQALGFIEEAAVRVRGGGRIELSIDTLCLHGDTPGAAEHARAIRRGLEAAGIEVRA
jgi:UPF0271 protein